MGMMVSPYRFGASAAAVPTYGVRASAQAYSAGDAAVNVPESTLIGDLTILVAETSTAIGTPPSGWTEVTGSPVSGTGTFLSVFYRIASANGEVAGNRANVAKAIYGDHLVQQTMWVRGSTGVPHVVNTGLGSSATNNLPSVTTTNANALVLLIASHGVDTSSSRFTWSADASLTSGAEIIDYSATNGDGGGVGVFAAVKLTPGSIGTSTVTQPGATSTPMLTLAFVG